MKKLNSVAKNISDSLDEIYYGSYSEVEFPYIPKESEYLYTDDNCIKLETKASEYLYQNPRTGEMFFFTRKSNYKGLVFVRQIAEINPYGICPKCGYDVKSRERRINGNDTCINDHVYKSSESIKKQSLSSIYLNRPFRNPEVDNEFSVYILHDDKINRIDFRDKKSDEISDMNTAKYWSNKIGKFNVKTQTNS